MNKFLTFVLLTLFNTVLGFGQINPSCNDLIVENLELDSDSTMKVTIRNNCSSCSSIGYCNIWVIQNSLDTIADTKCFCFFTPDNDTNEIYSLYSTAVTIPPINQLRVSMSSACDSIQFSPTLGINENKKKENGIKVYPSPTKENLRIEISKGVSLKAIKLYDLNGKLIKTFSPTDTLLDLTKIAEGQYLLIIESEKGTYSEKIVKQ